MRKKLRIFTNIAIICLSVCMFAFGVYAANTVSVTTSGTVTFQASGVYARVTRTVTGAKTNPENIVQEIDSTVKDGAEPFKMGDKESLEFVNATTPIVMTFTIENLATDRNLDFTITDNCEEDDNSYKTCVVSAYQYDTINKKYNVSPKVDNVNNTETITIKFYVNDENISATLSYDYLIKLTDQTNVDSKITQTANLKKAGNTYVATSTLETGNQVAYVYTGTNYFEYAPKVTNTNTVTSAIHVFGTDVTAIDVKNEPIDTTTYSFTNISTGKTSISRDGTITENSYFPVVINDSTNGVQVITAISEYGFTSSSFKMAGLPGGLLSIGEYAFAGSWDLVLKNLPQGVTNIGEGAFISCSSLALKSLPYGITEISASCFDGTAIELTELPEGITKISSCAFYNCANLKLTKLPDGITEIESQTFTSCLQVNISNLPKALTVMGRIKNSSEAPPFYSTATTSLVVYTKVTSFEGYCLSDISSITYKGTIDQWKVININSEPSASDGVVVTCSNGTVKYNTDGTVEYNYI